MRVITLNVNGIRSAAAKGLFPWLAQQQADVICLQEVRAREEQFAGHDISLPGYHAAYYPAERPGYAGVALYSRAQPERVVRGFGAKEFDGEGRYLEAQFPGLAVVSLYLPSGSSGPERQKSKDRFLKAFLPYLRALRHRRRSIFWRRTGTSRTGKSSLKNWRANPEELRLPAARARAWLDELFDEVGHRRLSQRECAARAVHLVVQSRPGGEERRLAHRLPDRQSKLAGTARATRFQGAALSRPRPVDHGLRAVRAERPIRRRASATRCWCTSSRA
jgi:exodeoxyribonuclease-3